MPRGRTFGTFAFGSLGHSASAPLRIALRPGSHVAHRHGRKNQRAKFQTAPRHTAPRAPCRCCWGHHRPIRPGIASHCGGAHCRSRRNCPLCPPGASAIKSESAICSHRQRGVVPGGLSWSAESARCALRRSHGGDDSKGGGMKNMRLRLIKANKGEECVAVRRLASPSHAEQSRATTAGVWQR